jgi:hypothetical protein
LTPRSAATEDQVITGDERVDLVTVRNRLSSDATVTSVDVEGTDGTIRVSDVSKPATVPAGEERTVDAAITCSAEADPEAELTVSVTVEADAVTAAISGDTATRTFEVDCADVEAHGGDVRFAGSGNVHFDGWSQDTLNVTYWTGSGDRVAEHGPVEVDASKSLKSTVRGGQTDFVAVYVEESNETHFHPNFDTATGEMGTPGQGNANETVVDGKQNPNDF